MRALRSPGSTVGGASFELSHPHCLHSFASGSMGSPQKLQYFFTVISSSNGPMMCDRAAHRSIKRTSDHSGWNSRKRSDVICLCPVFIRFSAAPFLALLALANIARSSAMAQQTRPAAEIPTIELRPGVVITKSARVIPRTYQLTAAAGLDSGIVVIRGNDITVDFSGATMEGMPADSNPDLARGVAILVDSGRNVRIIGVRIRGYKIGILARGTKNLSLIGNDLS